MSNLYTGITNATSKTAVDLKGKDGLLTKEKTLQFGATAIGGTYLYNMFGN
jgi:hypothetical protein